MSIRARTARIAKVMLSSGLLDLLREYWKEAPPEGWLFPGKPKINLISSRQLNRVFTRPRVWLGSANPRRCTRSRTASRPIFLGSIRMFG